MPLGTDVCLGPGDIVLDGNPVPPYKGHSSPPPIFGPCLFWKNDRPSELLLSTCHITSDTFLHDSIKFDQNHSLNATAALNDVVVARIDAFTVFV